MTRDDGRGGSEIYPHNYHLFDVAILVMRRSDYMNYMEKNTCKHIIARQKAIIALTVIRKTLGRWMSQFLDFVLVLHNHSVSFQNT